MFTNLERVLIVLNIFAFIAIILPYPTFSDSSTYFLEKVLTVVKFCAIAVPIITACLCVFRVF